MIFMSSTCSPACQLDLSQRLHQYHPQSPIGRLGSLLRHQIIGSGADVGVGLTEDDTTHIKIVCSVLSSMSTSIIIYLDVYCNSVLPSYHHFISSHLPYCTTIIQVKVVKSNKGIHCHSKVINFKQVPRYRPHIEKIVYCRLKPYIAIFYIVR